MNKRLRSSISSVGLVLLLSKIALASDLIPEFDSIIRSVPEGKYLDLEKRSNFVASVAAYCRTTLTGLPTNTPEEAKWLHDEMQTTDIAKVQRLYLSKEYARFKLVTTFAGCIETSKQISQAQKNSDVRLEAQLYLVLLSDFEGTDMNFYSQKANVDASRYGMGLFGIIRDRINRIAATAIRDIR
jgi:hypothetical protein